MNRRGFIAAAIAVALAPTRKLGPEVGDVYFVESGADLGWTAEAWYFDGKLQDFRISQAARYTGREAVPEHEWHHIAIERTKPPRLFGHHEAVARPAES